MVIGPDLTSWKLTEARLWAMLRDEESLQASREIADQTLYYGGGRCASPPLQACVDFTYIYLYIYILFALYDATPHAII